MSPELSDDVVQSQFHKIASEQFTVDGEVKQREMTDAVIDREPHSNLPDVPSLRRSLRTNDTDSIPRFGRIWNSFNVKHSDLQ
jgi:hypothetical protein